MNEWTLQTNGLEENYAQLTDKPQKSEILVEKGSYCKHHQAIIFL